MERDRFFTPEEAVDYGLIDRVHADRNGERLHERPRGLRTRARPAPYGRRAGRPAYLPVAVTVAVPSASPAANARRPERGVQRVGRGLASASRRRRRA